MKSLNPASKVWYNFLCGKLKPNLHLSTVTKDKTILLYAIIHVIKFNVGHVIESGIIESTQGRCTGALIHPSLITQLCRAIEVPMLESEEKSQNRLPLMLSKAKNGVPDGMDEEEKEVVVVRQQSEED